MENTLDRGSRMSVMRLRNTTSPGKGAQFMYIFVYVYICTHIYTLTNTYIEFMRATKCKNYASHFNSKVPYQHRDTDYKFNNNLSHPDVVYRSCHGLGVKRFPTIHYIWRKYNQSYFIIALWNGHQGWVLLGKFHPGFFENYPLIYWGKRSYLIRVAAD